MHSWTGFHFHLMVGALQRVPQCEHCCRVWGVAERILLQSEWSGVDMCPHSLLSMGWSCSWDISRCSKYWYEREVGRQQFCYKTSNVTCPWWHVSILGCFPFLDFGKIPLSFSFEQPTLWVCSHSSFSLFAHQLSRPSSATSSNCSHWYLEVLGIYLALPSLCTRSMAPRWCHQDSIGQGTIPCSCSICGWVFRPPAIRCLWRCWSHSRCELRILEILCRHYWCSDKVSKCGTKDGSFVH